ncbi:hypothetical protein AB1Y20_014874 [Prymnesium parvum]|uniref:CHAT domain-containing protein n=1 Tax=Prymnesium parvum TaxID=97485 RepID=A0AB34JW67_PRYPA
MAEAAAVGLSPSRRPPLLTESRSPRPSRDAPLRVLAVFCNPKGTDALRLQAEQRILQRCLPPGVAALTIQPAATLDDLQQTLMVHSFDVIHFSGHGCIDAPLGRLLRQMFAEVQQCLPAAVHEIKRWLSDAPPLEADGPALLLTLRPADARASLALEGGADAPACGEGGAAGGVPPAFTLRLTSADFSRHRVGSLAFESATGALEPPKPEVLARLLAKGLSPAGRGGGGVVFLNACDTAVQARWLLQHGAPSVIFCPRRISDGAAAEFSRGFYDALVSHRDVAAAYEQGQLAVELKFDTDMHGCPLLEQHAAVARGAAEERLPSPPPPLAAAEPSAAAAADPFDAAARRGADAAAGRAEELLLDRMEEFKGELCVGGQADLRELVPMPGARRMAVCTAVPRMVRDALGRLHPLGSFRIEVPRLEAALPDHMHALPDPNYFRRAHRLLGRAHDLKVSALNKLALGDASLASAQFEHALRLFVSVREQSASHLAAEPSPPTPPPHAPPDDAAAPTDGGGSPRMRACAAADARGATAALPMYPTLQVQLGEADTLLSLASPHLRRWSPHTLQVQLGEADTLLSLATVHLHMRRPDRGVGFAERALAIYTSIDASAQAAVVQLLLAALAIDQMELPQAEELLRTALKGFARLDCVLGEAEALRLLGALRLKLSDEHTGRLQLREAVRAYHRLQRRGASSPYGLAEAARLLGDDRTRTGPQEGRVDVELLSEDDDTDSAMSDGALRRERSWGALFGRRVGGGDAPFVPRGALAKGASRRKASNKSRRMLRPTEREGPMNKGRGGAGGVQPASMPGKKKYRFKLRCRCGCFEVDFDGGDQINDTDECGDELRLCRA